MANLEKATSIYIDFNNMLFNTDKYVLETIYKTMKERGEFKSFFEILRRTGGGIDDIKYFINQKKYKNPIIEIIAMSDVDSMKSLDIEHISDLYYTYILYELENENLDVELTPTDTANALRVLLSQDSLESIFVYMKVPRPELCDAVYNFFTGSTKVFICTGDRADMFNEYKFDTYIFEDIDDTESLLQLPADIHKDILIPAYKYNFNKEGYIKVDNDKYVKANMSISSLNLPL